MDNALVRMDVEGPIARITLTHAEKRNALSRSVLTSLVEDFRIIGHDPRIRVAILGAEGSVFSSGHDLRELLDGSEDDIRSLFSLCTEAMESIRLLPQPVIAQVSGFATAAGCQLVATCDLVVASATATFATPGVTIGLFCTTPAVALSRAVPTKKALEMLLTGVPITAQEAEKIGLVNRVVEPSRLVDETQQIAERICSVSRDAVIVGKKAFYRQLPLDYPAAYALAEPVMAENALRPDAQEGIRAFLEKRPPHW